MATTEPPLETATLPPASSPARSEVEARKRRRDDESGGLRVMMLDPSAALSAVTHNLCNELAEAGCEVDLFTAPFWERSVGRCPTRRYRPRVEFYRRSQMRAHQASSRPGKLFWKAAQLLGHVWMLIRLLFASRRYDVVHCQWMPVAPVDAVWLWLVSRWTPVAYTVHNLLPHDTRRERWDRLVYGTVYRAADVLFVHTDSTGRGLREEFGIADHKISRIRHGNMAHLLDLEPRAPSLDLPDPDVPTILFLGQIRPYKGLDVLLEAAGQLAASTEFKILVAGRPRVDRSTYRRLADELGLEDRVDFHWGYIEEDELPAYFREATVLAFPYREVDQSGVAISACTFGKPIVASEVGGLAEIVEEGENGLLVPPDDPTALAGALQRMLEDEELRRRCQENSRIYAETSLSWSWIASETVSAYGRARARDGSVAPVPAGSS